MEDVSGINDCKTQMINISILLSYFGNYRLAPFWLDTRIDDILKEPPSYFLERYHIKKRYCLCKSIPLMERTIRIFGDIEDRKYFVLFLSHIAKIEHENDMIYKDYGVKLPKEKFNKALRNFINSIESPFKIYMENVANNHFDTLYEQYLDLYRIDKGVDIEKPEQKDFGIVNDCETQMLIISILAHYYKQGKSILDILTKHYNDILYSSPVTMYAAYSIKLKKRLHYDEFKGIPTLAVICEKAKNNQWYLEFLLQLAKKELDDSLCYSDSNGRKLYFKYFDKIIRQYYILETEYTDKGDVILNMIQRNMVSMYVEYKECYKTIEKIKSGSIFDIDKNLVKKNIKESTPIDKLNVPINKIENLKKKSYFGKTDIMEYSILIILTIFTAIMVMTGIRQHKLSKKETEYQKSLEYNSLTNGVLLNAQQ